MRLRGYSEKVQCVEGTGWMVGEDVVVELWYQGQVSRLTLNVGLDDWMTTEETKKDERKEGWVEERR